MTQAQHTAYFVSTLEGFTGTAELYKLVPPMKYSVGDDEWAIQTEYVVVSATFAMFSGPETYIFPSDENGNITMWIEMVGSYKGGLCHSTALEGAGYSIAKVQGGAA